MNYKWISGILGIISLLCFAQALGILEMVNDLFNRLASLIGG